MNVLLIWKQKITKLRHKRMRTRINIAKEKGQSDARFDQENELVCL